MQSFSVRGYADDAAIQTTMNVVGEWCQYQELNVNPGEADMASHHLW